MSDEFTVLSAVAARLDAAGIGYMLSGSVAMGYYAQPRMTRDIDVVVELGHAEADALVATLVRKDSAYRENVKNLLVSVPDLDRSYLDHWIGALGLGEVLQAAQR